MDAETKRIQKLSTMGNLLQLYSSCPQEKYSGVVAGMVEGAAASLIEIYGRAKAYEIMTRSVDDVFKPPAENTVTINVEMPARPAVEAKAKKKATSKAPDPKDS